MKIASRMSGISRSTIRKIFDSAPSDAVNLGLGEIRFPTPRLLLDFGHQVLEDGFISYTSNAGLPEVRKSIADYYENAITQDCVCVTNGAEEALFATIMSIVDPGDEVLLTDPCFVAYETVVRMAGGKPVFIELLPGEDFRLKPDRIREKITPATKCLLLSNPSNPLSKVFDALEIETVVRACSDFDLTLISDEIYRELYYDNRPATFLDLSENAIVISGLSKSHCMTGWRLGWAVCRDKQLLDTITNSHQYISTCASYISQRVAVKALSTEGMNAVKALRNKLKPRLEILLGFLTDRFPDFRYLHPGAAPYLFFSLGGDDVEITRKFAENGLIVIPGSAFGTNGKNWIRMNYCVQDPDFKNLFTKLSALSL